MIDIRNIFKEYHGFFALKDVSLTVEAGEFVALVGASGSGKSTLLNIIGQIDVPAKGEVVIDGVVTSAMNDNQKAGLRNKLFGFIFQSFYLESKYSVLKNVEIPLIIRGLRATERKTLAVNALETVGLKDKAKNLAGTLSGGEMQRAAIARAIAGNPQIILADEPCGNLDTVNGGVILNLLKALNDAGKTVIMVTHNSEHAMAATRLIRLKDGELVSDEKHP
ncbi:MAG: ABC transporter ATP-binding protein [Clostridiales bacterium]|jgi:putative ABC transport system ATP-binding protein|nr:ABC transporter ATP-binding protein [Clostridiales bacterium]